MTPLPNARRPTIRHVIMRVGLVIAVVALQPIAGSADAASAGTDCAPTAAPTTAITQTRSTQVIVAQRTTGARGTFIRYQWFEVSSAAHAACAWGVMGQATAYFGARGVVPASQRVQNSYTTPAGRFPLLSAFGLRNLGTQMPFTVLNRRDWWDERPASRTYNQMLTKGPAGCDPANCEHLTTFTGAAGGYMYNQSVVIGYNVGPHRVRHGKGSGAGIFLHYGTGPTAGCVAIASLPELRATVIWLDPAAHPLIVIRR